MSKRKEESVMFDVSEHLANNPRKRVPCTLVLDVSTSMTGEPIEELKKGIGLFYDAVADDTIARDSVEISMIAFNHEIVYSEDFELVENKTQPDLHASGGTVLSTPVAKALDMLDERKQSYKSASVDYFQPWVVIMTDGYPQHDNMDALKQVQAEMRKRESQRKLVVFPIGIGDDADLDILSDFSNNKDALKLQGMKFKQFFEWLSQSVKTVSNSSDKDTSVSVPSPAGWADISL